MNAKPITLLVAAVACVSATLMPFRAHAEDEASPIARADNQTIEVITVTARKREESLQDAPVTVTRLDSHELARYQLDSILDVAKRIPTANVQTGQSGAGGSISLRGIGSSAISAAFDSAVLLDIDGVPISTARLVQNSFLDLEQIDVLKGPQSLYFGKSASAGVLSFRSADPGDEFEAGLKAVYESEKEGLIYEGVISGPLSDTFGARLAVQYSDTDVITENTLPGVANPDRGEETLDARLTLAWNPTDRFAVNLKFTQSEYESDGPVLFNDVECGVRGTPAPFPLQVGPGVVIPFPVTTDCDSEDGEIQFSDPTSAYGPRFGNFSSTIPFVDSELTLARLKLEFDLTRTLTLVSVSSVSDFDTIETDNFAYSSFNIIGSGAARNRSENVSQELRLSSTFDGAFNFMFGAYYQDRDVLLDAIQNPLGLTPLGTLNPMFLAPTPDPVTGFTHDYQKTHETTAETLSFFGSVDIDLSERWSLSGGLRYTDEDKEQTLSIPYAHTFGVLAGVLLPSGTVLGPIEFDDDNVSGELSLVHWFADQISVYGAYKTGFKSGGIDNSLLPFTPILAAAATNDFSSLIFESETAEGFEVGLKSMLLDGSMRLNATAYRYVYEDLQIQSFDAATINFTTSNVGEITSQGLEVDLLWLPQIKGLSIEAVLAFTDTSFTETFIGDEDLNGRDAARAPDVAGNVGVVYSRPLSSELVWTIAGRATYSSDYFTDELLRDDPKQDDYVTLDVNFSIASASGRWSLSLIANNVFDEVIVARTLDLDRSVTPTSRSDVLTTISRGRELFFQAQVNF